MLGLTFDIESIYFCCFRQPTTTSLILSFPIPPFTTIRGFLENALGYERDSFALQNEKLLIGIRPIGKIERNTELAKILKLISREEKPCFKRSFPSAPMFKNFLIEPKYRIYLVGEENLINKISEKLENPERPLYLGQSDDLVDINNFQVVNIEKTQSNKIWSVVEGVYNGCEIVKLPYRFINNGKDIEMRVFSVPEEFPLKLEKNVECFRLGEENVQCI
ncbi:MAG TPA: CRISPR-associated protein Cas5 [Candidatus Desulfofervidus auxilii]|uniref:CRISPR-associated protein Cas5 n=1 Tax=Desulfofervidus auxilii TaxID=1621989 RepID=A0A7C0U2T1_DESA2|nr:CRISPR-associated protein Cas5 [Candidatus Desulfofervidus auxilii]